MCEQESLSLKQNTTEYHKFKKLRSRDGTTETVRSDESALIETDLCLSQYPPAPPRISRRKKLTAAAAEISPPPPKNKNTEKTLLKENSKCLHFYSEVVPWLVETGFC